MPSQRCVLVVDSDPSDLSSTVSLLEGAGYRVATASAFDEAKQLQEKAVALKKKQAAGA